MARIDDCPTIFLVQGPQPLLDKINLSAFNNMNRSMAEGWLNIIANLSIESFLTHENVPLEHSFLTLHINVS